jgi:hypothetical protein
MKIERKVAIVLWGSGTLLVLVVIGALLALIDARTGASPTVTLNVPAFILVWVLFAIACAFAVRQWNKIAIATALITIALLFGPNLFDGHGGLCLDRSYEHAIYEDCWPGWGQEWTERVQSWLPHPR